MPQILVIDDNALEREAYKAMLEQAGYTVLEAPDGKAGIHMFHRQPCEVVITDIYMPEQDGLETIRVLKKDYPALRIIAVSGGGDWMPQFTAFNVDLAIHAASGLGADYALRKPVSRQQLLDAVNAALGV